MKKRSIEEINFVENIMIIFEKKAVLFCIFVSVLSSCEYTPKSTDTEAILNFINESIVDTEICLKDKEFHFPDVIVGPKYSGKGLVQLNALVSAGLLRETEQILSEPKYGPKYVYHYKQNNLIERKIFFLTDQGVKFYRMDQGIGYFCYGQPNRVKLEDVDSSKNDQGNVVLTAMFSFDVKVNPDATWISNPWIQREFNQAIPGQNRQNAKQQFIKDNQNLIKPVSTGLLKNRYW